MYDEIIYIIKFVLNAFIHVAPVLLVSVVLTVYVNNSDIGQKLFKHLKTSPYKAVLIATFIGAFSPLCSCGVIPVIATLLAVGTPLAPVMSFWLASPSIDPEIIFINVSMLGWEITIWRLLATITISLSAGYFTIYLMNKRFIKKSEVLRTTMCCSGGSVAGISVEQPQNSCGCSASGSPSNESILAKIFTKKNITSFWKTTVWISKLMLIAYVIEAVMTRYVPKDIIYQLLGDSNLFSVIIAAFVGIPFYTSSLPALGITAGLIGQGMSNGAALAFLIAGPTTTLPAMAAVYKITGKKVFVLYLLFTFAGAVITGYLYNFIKFMIN